MQNCQCKYDPWGNSDLNEWAYTQLKSFTADHIGMMMDRILELQKQGLPKKKPQAQVIYMEDYINEILTGRRHNHG